MSHTMSRRSLGFTTMFFVALTLLFTYPVWTAPATLLTELADVRLVTWTLAWDAHALIADPLNLFNANIFFPHDNTLALSENFVGAALAVAPLNWAGYPILAYNVLLLASFVLGGVGTTLWVRSITGSLPAGLIAGVIWAFAPGKFDQLSHLHMMMGQWIPFALFFCSRYVVTGRARYLMATALLAAIQFTFSMHYGLFLLPFLALYGAALLVLLPDARARQQLGTTARQLVVAGILFAVVVGPLALPYMSADGDLGLERGYREMVRYSGHPHSYLSGSGFNRAVHIRGMYQRYVGSEANYFIGTLPLGMAILALVWGLSSAVRHTTFFGGPSTATAAPRPSWQVQFRQRTFAVAVVIAGFSLALHVAGLLVTWWRQYPPALQLVVDLSQQVSPAVWLALASCLALLTAPPALRRGEQGAARVQLATVAVLTLIAYLLAFGPEVWAWRVDLGRGPYWLLYQWVSPFRGIRAVGRIGLMWIFFASALVGFALAAALNGLVAARRRRETVAPGISPEMISWGTFAVLLVLVVWEYRVWPLPYQTVAPIYDEGDAWLAQQAGDFAVVHAPIEPGPNAWRETRYMLGSTVHWKKLVNGYSGFFPPDYYELSQAGVLTPEFFKLLRSDFPVRYLLVHRERLANEEQYARLLRLLERNDDAIFVGQFGLTYVFEVPRDKGSGDHVRRRYTSAQLRDSRGVQFLIHGQRIAGEAGVIVLAGWGDETEMFEVTDSWEGARVVLPQGFFESLDGKPGSFEIRTHQLVPLGGTSARLASGFTVDAQAAGVVVGLGRLVFDEAAAAGLRAYRLERFGTRLVEQRTFPPTAAGAADLRSYVEALPQGAIVAMALTLDIVRPLDSASIEALRAIGADPPAGDVPMMVAVGVRGTAPGQALQHAHPSRAVIDIEALSPSVELRGIGLF